MNFDELTPVQLDNLKGKNLADALVHFGVKGTSKLSADEKRKAVVHAALDRELNTHATEVVNSMIDSLDSRADEAEASIDAVDAHDETSEEWTVVPNRKDRRAAKRRARVTAKAIAKIERTRLDAAEKAAVAGSKGISATPLDFQQRANNYIRQNSGSLADAADQAWLNLTDRQARRAWSKLDDRT